MKIAITSTGETLDCQVDPRFGRAQCFIIIETETMDHTVIENASVSAAGGAGVSAGQTVADAGAKAVLTGNCGPNAQRTLDAAGITLYTDVTGTVAEAVEQFKRGTLTPATGPNVQSHFGMGK
jgi:predicted Fe-Mo cluster-binding NifX family protein